MSASLTSNQLYELRPLCDLTKNMAIGSGSHVNGAKAILYEELYYVNDQKWILTDDSTGWSIRNMESLKYAVVWWPTSDNPFVAGSDIVQWEGGSENRYWTPQQVSTETVGGTECPVVVFKCTAHDGLAISVSDAYYYGSSKVKLAATDTTKDTQKWVCIPTVARDYGIASPLDLGVSGNTVKNAANSLSFTVYPQWSVPSEIAAMSGVAYLIRSRKRTKNLNGEWGAWTGWTDWSQLDETTGYTRTGQRVTATAALTASVGSTAKMARIAYQVRTCTPASGSGSVYDRPWAGAAIECAVDLYPRPSTTWDTASWSPTGLTIPVTSTYASRGPTTVSLESVKVSGAELLREPVNAILIGGSGTAVDVPQDMLLGIPANGATLVCGYKVGTDTYGMFPSAYSKSVSVSYTSGSVTPTVADNAGMTKKVTVSGGTGVGVWMLCDGVLYDCPGGVAAYPFGREYTLFASGTKNEIQFAWAQSYTGEPAGVHAWNWDGGFACLEVRDGEPLSVEDSIEAPSESYDLSGRNWETVDFSGARHQSVTARGAVVDGATSSQRDDFELLAGTHALYRSPRGDMFPVAVRSVSREAHKGWAAVDVTMAREG